MYVSDWWEHKRINEVVIDCYGNQMFWGVLKLLKSKGYYNNMEAKKASMEGTYRNYGWWYSAEQYVLRQNLDPRKYVDIVPKFREVDRSLWPVHILERFNRKG